MENKVLIKADQQWVTSQIRKEQYSNTKKNYQWQKPAWKKY